MQYKSNIFLLIFFLLAVVNVGNAQNQQYVSDQLEAPVRTGSGDSYRIQKMLRSGNPVEVLSEDRGTGYVEIRYGNAKGWIHNRFLMKEPAARTYVSAAKDKFEPLQNEINTHKNTITEKESNIALLDEDNLRLKQALQIQSEQLAQIKKASENVIQIDEENRTLHEKVAQQGLISDSLEKQNRVLLDNNRSNEWLKGASILFFGLIFGALILPRLLRFRTHKKNWNQY